MKNGYQFLRVFGAKPLSLILIIGLIACIPKPSPKKGSQQGAPDKAPPSSGGQADTSSLEGKNPPASPASPASPAGTNGKLAVVNKDFLAELPSGEDQRKVLCARGGSDKIRQVFCGTEPPKISSLKDLQKSLGLSPNSSGGILGIFFGSSGFVLTAHSSSLVGKFTSAANPRVIMFNNQGGNVALGFVRGEQFAEVIAQDPKDSSLKFFLVKFTQECNALQQGCNNGDLLGPAIESNWKSVTVYEDMDVENTIIDCKQCHQPGGEGNAKIFRMQELTNPWTHFLRANTAGGQELLADFQKVHGDEEFGGIPGEQINQSDPAKLERFVRGAGNGDQPNEFPSAVIAVTGRNGTWQNLYENFVNGKSIAPPYHGLKVADPTKFAAMTQSYKEFRAGTLDGAKLPDMRDILLESGLRDMGYMVKANMPADKILIQACSQCHNSSLNQKITRAKFDVELSKMDREEKDLAIERLKLPNDDPKKMPPVRFRTLTESEISQVQDLLKK